MVVQCKAEESLACSCVDVGAIIDGSDCCVKIEQIYPDERSAQTALTHFIEKARKIESEPCKMKSSITPIESGVSLSVELTFCCQAEAMIFELSTR